jgi:hypothetical protein
MQSAINSNGSVYFDTALLTSTKKNYHLKIP